MTAKNVASKRKNAPLQEYCTYTLGILNWKPRYMFSMNRDRARYPEPFSEHSIIEVTAKLILPEKHTDTLVECSIHGSREYDCCLAQPKNFEKYDAVYVGRLDIRTDYCGFYGWVPFSAIPMICSMLATGNYKYLELDGSHLRYRHATVHAITIRKELEQD